MSGTSSARSSYEPFESRTFRSDEDYAAYDVKLAKSNRPKIVTTGSVRRPDGSPLEGAEVAAIYPQDLAVSARLPSASIQNGRLQRQPNQDIVKTNAEGRFSLPRDPELSSAAYGLAVVHPDFVAEVGRAEFEADPVIIAKPWGRIEGQAFFGAQPASGARIRYSSDRLTGLGEPSLEDRGEVQADAEGRFTIERVTPGDTRVAREKSGANAWSNGSLITAKAGETVRVRLGGRGRPVIAKVVFPPGFGEKADSPYEDFVSLRSDPYGTLFPQGAAAADPAARNDWVKRWRNSPEGRAQREAWFMLGELKLQPDGLIRIEDVPPGPYQLEAMLRPQTVGVPLAPGRIVRAAKPFLVPPIPGGRSDQPFDAGVLRTAPSLKIGQLAPSFDVETLDGGRLKLEGFRGKYVLLNFWASWSPSCAADVPVLKTIYERFGKNERFAMISLSLDAGKDAPRRFVNDQKIAWPQGFLGDQAEGGSFDFYTAQGIPAMLLIGPDGKILSPVLRGPSVEAVIAKTLPTP